MPEVEILPLPRSVRTAGISLMDHLVLVLLHRAPASEAFAVRCSPEPLYTDQGDEGYLLLRVCPTCHWEYSPP